MVPATKNTHDLGPVPHPPTNRVSEDQVAVEAHLLKDLFELGAEDNTSAAGFHGIHDPDGELNLQEKLNSHDLGQPDFNSGGAA